MRVGSALVDLIRLGLQDRYLLCDNYDGIVVEDKVDTNEEMLVANWDLKNEINQELTDKMNISLNSTPI
jgi:hypothetical protein